MTFDAETVTALVTDFCRYRRVEAGSRMRVAPNLREAFDVVALKGPDRRWKTIISRPSLGDLAEPERPHTSAAAERAAYDHAVRDYRRHTRSPLTSPTRSWFLAHVVVSASHWARYSRSIRAARDRGLGWIIPANKDVLIVPRPALRCREDRPGVLHDDSGKMAVQWPDGTGFHFLQGTPFDDDLYHKVITGKLSLEQVAALDDADKRSIALTYMTFEHLVTRSNARSLDVGVKGTALYRLPLPRRIARDRVRGYGGYDYFIHMRDASHPEREFIEWVDPTIGVQRNAELCQAHAFGITLDQWLSIELEG